MHISRVIILMLGLFSILLGCEPTTNTELVAVSTDSENPVENYSNIEVGFDSAWTRILEGDVALIPVNVRNLTFMDINAVTTTVESDLPGFSTNDAEFALPAGSNHLVVIEFDASDMEVEIGQPQTRDAILVIETDGGEVHEVFIVIDIFDELDYTEDQLNLWYTTVYIDAEVGGAAVVKPYTVSSNWNEDVSYTATVTGAGCTVVYNGSGIMSAGSSNQIWTQYMPPAAMADPAHEVEQYLCLLTVAAADMVHEVTFIISVTNPDYGAGDDDDSAF